MKDYHCCATCIHYVIRKESPEKFFCRRLGYATKPKYRFDCWTPKNNILFRIYNKGLNKEGLPLTRIGLIRHGLTDWNVEKRAQGQSDIPLNESGRRQARALAERLRGEEWDYIFSSDLSRAKETADLVAEALGLSVQTDERLREEGYGEAEGTTKEERISRWGSEWKSLPLGIEDQESVTARGMSFIRDVSNRYPGKNILIVSHGALLGLTLKSLIPHEDTEDFLHNTSITLLRHESRWECELYNCAKHLAEEDR